MERAEESNILWTFSLFFSGAADVCGVPLGLQSQCKSAVLLVQSSSPFQHHFFSLGNLKYNKKKEN